MFTILKHSSLFLQSFITEARVRLVRVLIVRPAMFGVSNCDIILGQKFMIMNETKWYKIKFK